jgi:hypothetical protein
LSTSVFIRGGGEPGISQACIHAYRLGGSGRLDHAPQIVLHTLERLVSGDDPDLAVHHLLEQDLKALVIEESIIRSLPPKDLIQRFIEPLVSARSYNRYAGMKIWTNDSGNKAAEVS